MYLNKHGEPVITIQADTKELIAALTRNRAVHAEMYRQAALAFPAAVTTWLLQRAQRQIAQKEVVTQIWATTGDQLDQVADCVEKTVAAMRAADQGDMAPSAPAHHLADYDGAIRMLRMHVEPTIEIDSGMYERYVNDNWEWRARAEADWRRLGVRTLSR